MQRIKFSKMVATGNDFVVIQTRLKPSVSDLRSLARKICDRKFGIGADGLLVIGESKIADIKMRIFNADGSEAEMCGNGARCVSLFKSKGSRTRRSKDIKIETKAGIVDSEVKTDTVKIKLSLSPGIRWDIPIKINRRPLRVNFINTGVPHAVVFVEGLGKIDVFNIGRQIRYHRKFRPAGTNVNFVEVLSSSSIRIRTYERGVEDETLACGTGAIASAIIAAMALGRRGSYPSESRIVGERKIDVYTKSQEMLRVYFNNDFKRIENIRLEGKAKIICKGVYYV